MKRLILIIISLCLLNMGCTAPSDSPRIINDFESNTDLDAIVWKCHTLFTLSSDHVVYGKTGLRMALYPSPYPGVSFRDFSIKWSAYSHLYMDVYNPLSQGEVSLTLRVDDKKKTPAYNDRVNRRIVLKPGMNHVDIPLDGLITPSGRTLDLNHIYAFMMFMVHPLKETILYVDHVRLE